jgi:hypothetical protein
VWSTTCGKEIPKNKELCIPVIKGLVVGFLGREIREEFLELRQ